MSAEICSSSIYVLANVAIFGPTTELHTAPANTATSEDGLHAVERKQLLDGGGDEALERVAHGLSVHSQARCGSPPTAACCLLLASGQVWLNTI